MRIVIERCIKMAITIPSFSPNINRKRKIVNINKLIAGMSATNLKHLIDCLQEQYDNEVKDGVGTNG